MYQLRGEERKLLKESLKYIKPGTVREKLMNKMDLKLAEQDKNYQYSHSLGVLQKAKSDKNCENDQHPDDIADIVLRTAQVYQYHEYIRKFVSPFSIHLGCVEQMDILNKYDKLKFHFDATGSIVREPYPESKRICYYAGVVAIDKKVCPPLGFITNDHTAKFVSDFSIFMRKW